MGTAITNGMDVVGFLKAQHQQVKQLLASVLESSGDARAQAFFELRRMLAIHETAEEEIVHPAARKSIPNGEAIVAARLREENKAKKALTAMESMNLESPEFESDFRALEKDVLAHAESEEKEEFEVLATKLSLKQLERMRNAVKIAEAMAPTRPHAGLESAAGNMFAGPFVAMVDKARDALSGKTGKAPKLS